MTNDRRLVSPILIDVLIVGQVLANILALAFVAVVVWNNSRTIANQQEQLFLTQRSVVRCALVEELETLEAIARELGLRITIDAPNVERVDCEAILSRPIE